MSSKDSKTIQELILEIQTKGERLAAMEIELRELTQALAQRIDQADFPVSKVQE